MPKVETIGRIPKKEVYVFLIIDSSEMIGGGKIYMLNSIAQEIVDNIKNMTRYEHGVQIKIVVLEFSDGCRVLTTNGPENIEEFVWSSIDILKSKADFGSALKQLRCMIKELINTKTHFIAPIFVFFSSNSATDNYREELKTLKANKIYRYGIKIAITIGDHPDIDMLKEVVGNAEAIIKWTDLKLFRYLFRLTEVEVDPIAEEEPYACSSIGGYTTESNVEESVVISMPGKDVELMVNQVYKVPLCELIPCNSAEVNTIGLTILCQKDIEGNYKLHIKNECVEGLLSKCILQPLEKKIFLISDREKFSIIGDDVETEISKNLNGERYIKVLSKSHSCCVKHNFAVGTSFEMEATDQLEFLSGIVALKYKLKQQSLMRDMMAYSEVFAILNLLEDEYAARIPEKVKHFFKEEGLKGYEPKIDVSKSLLEQGLQRKTITLLAILQVNYWCDSEEERQALLRKFARNDGKIVSETEQVDYIDLNSIFEIN